MKWLVIVLSTAGMVAANSFPPPFDKLPPEEAAVAFKLFLKSAFNGQGEGDGNNNLFSLRGMLPPDVNLEEHSGYFQGDIVMDDVLIDNMVTSVLRNALIEYESQWPNNTVIYQFHDKDFDEEQRNAILEGMNIVSNNTCVKFRYRKPEDSTYVEITGNRTGCFAHVGYIPIPGRRILNYSPEEPGVGCLRMGTIIHELMHVLGFQHMHSTYDRDEYIRILEENILPGAEYFFKVFRSDQLSNLGVEYDYNSVLQYSPLAFSRNGNITIEALKPFDGVLGQREYVTDSDWLRINRHYDCPGAWDSENE